MNDKNICMETLMYFGRREETMTIKQTLIDTFQVNERAESFSVKVDLKSGDITCWVMHPSPLAKNNE